MASMERNQHTSPLSTKDIRKEKKNCPKYNSIATKNCILLLISLQRRTHDNEITRTCPLF